MSLSNTGQSRRSQWRVILVVAACVALGLFLAFSLTKQKPAPVPEAAEVIDVEGTRAKAEHGDAEAQKNLGAIYAKGQGLKQNYTEAAQWYRKAADQGNAAAQAALGELYEAGQGVQNDDAEAAKWYRRAAEQGHVGGQYCLAVLYTIGKGVSRDVAEAAKWYRRAAEQGNALAQYNFGMRCRDGDGVTPDVIEAFKWLSLAAAQDLADAASARDELKRSMTRDQVSEARRLVEKYEKGRIEAQGTGSK